MQKVMLYTSFGKFALQVYAQKAEAYNFQKCKSKTAEMKISIPLRKRMQIS